MNLKIKVLGCGDAFGTGGKHTTSFYLHGGEEGVLIDCGAGTLVRLKQEGILLSDIRKIVITHFHGDHYGGIPFLVIANQFSEGGTIPWDLIGPPGLKSYLYRLQETMYPGTGELLDQLPLTFYEYKENNRLDLGEVKVEAFAVQHSPLSLPHAIRITYLGSTVFYSGDTEWIETIETSIKESDLSIVECFTYSTKLPGHISFAELKEKCNKYSQKIYLTHLGPEMLTANISPFLRLEDGQLLQVKT